MASKIFHCEVIHSQCIFCRKCTVLPVNHVVKDCLLHYSCIHVISKRYAFFAYNGTCKTVVCYINLYLCCCTFVFFITCPRELNRPFARSEFRKCACPVCCIQWLPVLKHICSCVVSDCYIVCCQILRNCRCYNCIVDCFGCGIIIICLILVKCHRNFIRSSSFCRFIQIEC